MRVREGRRMFTAALAVPAAICLSWAPAAPAATVLGVEGTGQPKGTTQTAFQGSFCERNTCRSINNNRTPFDVALGSSQIHTAVSATPGDVIVMAYSLGAASTYHRLREWAEKPAKAPDPDRIVLVVTFGNPENKFGGDDRNLFWTGLPEGSPYQHLDVTMQYDSVADRPTRWGFFSSINTTFARHMAYFDDVDINDPDNLVYRDGNTTYMLIKADVLPMLGWLDWFVDDEGMAKLDATFRPLVERDYRRPAFTPQGDGADWGNGNPPPIVDGVTDPEPSERRSDDGDGDGDAQPSAADTDIAEGEPDADIAEGEPDADGVEDEPDAPEPADVIGGDEHGADGPEGDEPEAEIETEPGAEAEQQRETSSPTVAESGSPEGVAPDGAEGVAA
ncbi:PE-PPE, C-terminal domain protein [Mycolicibacterium vanbaalenii PYR-1]|uniref:PE-PPE, C-terminal domain protein n=1 Tax=Mycolicibacterium vanbaalenii (strain DSM 7251 / JCM 13017 / BCRC 16820 / KCTC 9966 / NRRL B-24157 / PYR-1) TaxID=350058 RepID=A1T122_MYCVP|nr:PE-PPE domain-containing protein [Mycolicibacterium vanbaalenii]ABM10872.1 PE-PPE, C-terminal domain protein [Mycolicibacterium vanbaalenii PYR-1]